MQIDRHHLRVVFSSLKFRREWLIDQLAEIEAMVEEMRTRNPWLEDSTDGAVQGEDDLLADALISEIRRCTTQYEATMMVAASMGREVHAREIAELLLRSGRWHGTFNTLRSRVTRILRGAPDWHAVGNGRYHRVCPWDTAPDSTK